MPACTAHLDTKIYLDSVFAAGIDLITSSSRKQTCDAQGYAKSKTNDTDHTSKVF